MRLRSIRWQFIFAWRRSVMIAWLHDVRHFMATTMLSAGIPITTLSASLRQRGVVMIGSGNVVHNLRRVDWGQPDGGFDWSHRFDDAARAHMTSSPNDIVTLRDHQGFGAAVPSPTISYRSPT